MTLLQDRQTPVRVPEISWLTVHWRPVASILGVLSSIAAFVGFWTHYAADDATLTLFTWTWSVEEIASNLIYALIVFGLLGVMVATAVAAVNLYSRRWHELYPTLLTSASILSFIVAAVYAAMWIF